MLVRLASPDVAAGKHDVSAAANLGWHDVHVHNEQATLVNGIHDGLDLTFPVAGRH